MVLHSAADAEYIDGLPTRAVKLFRDYTYTPAFIAKNPHLFVDTAWIDVAALRAFLADQGDHSDVAPAVPVRVKRESDTPTLLRNVAIPKTEDVPASLPVRTRSIVEGNRQIIELLSDSDDDSPPSSPAGLLADLAPSGSSHGDSSPRIQDHRVQELCISDTDNASNPRSSSPQTDGLFTSEVSDESGAGVGNQDSDIDESDTVWLDPEITSTVRRVNYRLTSDARTQINELEYIMGGIPSGIPVPRGRKAYLLDLSGPDFEFVDEKDNLITVDGLVRRKDNDSWIGNSGTGNNEVVVTFEPGERHLCRRSRNDCAGVYACSTVDEKLLQDIRYELDVTSRDRVLAAQRETRRTEGDTPEQRATVFFDRIQSTRCTARRADGTLCDGKPKLKKNKQKIGGKSHWIACDGWTPSFKESHRTHSIPTNIDEALVIRLFEGRPLSNNSSIDTKPCSRIVHPHIGGRIKTCHHPHIVNGKSVPRCPIVHRKCPCKITFYVPVDPSVRKMIIFFPKGTPHNHPVQPPLKASHEAVDRYGKCVDARGIMGASVAKVESAPSTGFLMDGQTPGEFAPALQNVRLKREIIKAKKKKAYPAGLGLPGAFQLYQDDLKKDIRERYIHRFEHKPDGSLIIFTCLAPLLALLDDPATKAFEDDTTFKRIEGDINEWEVVTFFNPLESAVTIARAYVNRSDTAFFERLFDMFREIKREVTGRDICFARFMPDGNLLVMNADMEAAQALGAARSFMKTNVPSFSGITTLDPQLFATFFIKFCCEHAARPVNEFKSLVSSENFLRLKEFLHIDSVESLQAFSEFIRNLGVKKIQDWWSHKEMNAWIIPCLVKSQSNILPAHWDSTPPSTNTGESMHHSTNTHTGTKLALVEGIESARALDSRVVSQIKIAVSTGVLKNSNNELFHRMGRSSQRQATSAKKSREYKEQTERVAQLQASIHDQKAALKEHQDELKSLKGTSARGSKSKSQKTDNDSIIVSANSCGRVKTVAMPRRKTTSGAASASAVAAAPAPPTKSSSQPPSRSTATAPPELASLNDDTLEVGSFTGSVDVTGGTGEGSSLSVGMNWAPFDDDRVLLEYFNDVNTGVLSAPVQNTSLSALPNSFNDDAWFNPPAAASTGLGTWMEFSHFGLTASDFNSTTVLPFTNNGAPSFSPSITDSEMLSEFQNGFQVPRLPNVDFDFGFLSEDASTAPPAVEAGLEPQYDLYALTPPQELPTLPPPPTSSPGIPASSPVPIQVPAKRIRQEGLDPNNIVHSKRQRTASARLTAAEESSATQATKKPKSKR